MKKKATEWCTMTGDNQGMLCQRCGGMEQFIVPAPIGAFILRIQAFLLQHKHCQPREEPADAP